MRTTRHIFSTAALSLGLACGSSAPTTPTQADVVGTYTLRSNNGIPIPMSATSGSITTTLVTEQSVIRADLTFEVTTQYIITTPNGSSPAQGHTTGTYQATSGGSIQFRPSASLPLPYSGVVRNDTLIATFPTNIYVYTRTGPAQ